ncbi:hypothetical protein BDR07DRAFT_1490321 [Suillus spraguei]|nr:hypothetical protein BDR07DRAFT_1490321 [Suillus spraguei]
MSPHKSSSATTQLLISSELGSDAESESVSSSGALSSLTQDLKSKSKVKHNNMVNNQKKGNIAARDQCLHFACWIPCAIDMFCNLNDIFHIVMLMEEEEASKVLSEPEDEDVKAQRDKVLSYVSKDAQERYMKNYSKILLGAPYLHKLARGNLKQWTELHAILAEVIMSQVRSDDASHLKSCIAQYAAPDPLDKGLQPPIYTDNKSHALLGVNHPQLAGMLCPIKHAKAYHEDPKKVQAQLQNGDIRIHSAAWPAFIYEGTPPGTDFDPDNVQEGFLKGYYLKWVFCHIFMSPSSALIPDGEMNVTDHRCNAKLHGMKKVEPKHIAYTFIQSQFSIAMCDKWQETDGCYKYSEAYTRLIKAIQEAPDQTWAESLLQWWNKMVFGNKNGLVIDLTKDNEDDDLTVMQRQHKMHVAAAHQEMQLPEGAAATSAIAEDTTVPLTSMTQFEAANSLVLPLPPPLLSATPRFIDTAMESAK